MTDVLKILCVSDFHLCAEVGDRFQGVDVDRSVRDVLKTAYARGFDGLGVRGSDGGVPDVIVMLGDVTQSHTYGDRSRLAYLRARGYLVSLGKKKGVDIPVVYTYGNHDDLWMMDRYFGGYYAGEEFPGSFGRKCVCDELGWTLLGLDTHRPHAVEGRVSERELRWLEDELSWLEGYALVFGHHPLKPVGASDLDRHVVENGDAICDLLASCDRVVGYISGHVHMEFSYRALSGKMIECGVGETVAWGGRGCLQLLGVPATSFQFKRSEGFIVTGEVPGWRAITVDSKGMLKSCVGRLDECDWEAFEDRLIGPY